ncbi:helicase assembly protein [Pantoea phage Phynn]|nr:helicase assembly protein [Pantoea phage Phynn]
MRFKTPFVGSEANSRLKPIAVYKLYLVMKNHFAGKYDAIKYRWEIKVTEASFSKRKDRYFFAKLAERFTFKEIYFIFLSNMVANPEFWVGSVDEDSIVFYRQYIGKLRRIDNVFVDEVKNLYEFSRMKGITLNQVFAYSEKSSTSYIIKLLQANVVSYETFLILDSILGIINRHDEIAKDFVWNELSKKLNAYKKIVEINNENQLKYKALLKETIVKLNEINK